MWDPYPTKLFLTRGEVADMLSMSTAVFNEFLGENPDFPQPIPLPGAKKRDRWEKAEVLLWVLHMKRRGRPRQQAEDGDPE